MGEFTLAGRLTFARLEFMVECKGLHGRVQGLGFMVWIDSDPRF